MTGKSVLVTGCSAGGIGAALAVVFAKHDCHVFATAWNLDKMAPLKEQANITLLALDPTSDESVKAAFKEVQGATNGRLDVLINNAGQTTMAPVLDFDIDEARKMYDINLWGAMRVTQVFTPLVIAAKGTLVYTCSISSICRTPWLGVYAASKAALVQIADTLRSERSPFDVKVVTVMTGAVQTHILDNGKDFKLPSGSIYQPIESKIAARARGEDGVKRQSAEEYAESVVKDVLKGANTPLYKGAFPGVAKFMSSYMPVSLWDSLASKGCGLEEIKGSL